jgi:hypothetical protein
VQLPFYDSVFEDSLEVHEIDWIVVFAYFDETGMHSSALDTVVAGYLFSKDGAKNFRQLFQDNIDEKWTDLTAKVVICEAFVEGNIRKALGHMTKRKSNVAQDFRSAKVQNLAQAMFALSVATLTFSTCYTQSRLAAKLQV